MFKLLPIQVCDKEKKLSHLVESKKIFKNKIPTLIKLTTLSNIPIKEIEVYEHTVIRLSQELKEVKIVYFDENNAYLGEEKLSLINTSKKEIMSEKELEYLKLKNEIRLDMDSPKGSEIEVSKHTELLKNSIIDENARKFVTSKIRNYLINYGKSDPKELEELTYRLYAELYGLGAIQELDDDEEIGEIMINAKTFPFFKCDIYYIKNQVKYKLDKTIDSITDVENIFRRIIEFSKKELNATDNAMIEASRPNKDRVNIVIPNASENWSLNIRKFTNFVPSTNNMKASGTIDSFNEKLIEKLVKGHCNIGIGGFMGVGKTTLMNYQLTYTDPISRKVIIASISETDVEKILPNHDVVICNVDDIKGFTFEKHLKFALRSTADRVIVPEARGSEFKQIYEACTKTSGNMFTGHAFDAESFMDVCVEMYKSDPSGQMEKSSDVKNKIANVIDIVIILRKVGSQIRIKSISEVIVENGKYKGINHLQEWEIDEENPLKGRYKVNKTTLSDRLRNKLLENLVPMKEIKELEKLMKGVSDV